jgi:hypothetical protein
MFFTGSVTIKGHEIYYCSLAEFRTKFVTTQARYKTKNSYEDSGLLECDAAPLGKWIPTFRKYALPSSSRVQCSRLDIPEDLNLQLYRHESLKIYKI